jgi:hypothetical protein
MAPRRPVVCYLVWSNSLCGLEKVGHADLPKNLRIGIAAKVLVQAKNLFRLKGRLEPCLVDANTTQHLFLRGEILRALHYLYIGSEPIKWGAREGLPPHCRLQNIAEVTSPVKNKKEEEEADHSSHCEQ